MEWSRCRSQPQQAQQAWATRKQHDTRQRQQGGQEHELHLRYPETTGDDKCMYLHVQVNSLCSMHWTRTWRATRRLCHWILEWRLFSSEANYGFSVRGCFPLPKSTGCISHIHLRKWQECNHMKKQAKKRFVLYTFTRGAVLLISIYLCLWERRRAGSLQYQRYTDTQKCCMYIL